MSRRRYRFDEATQQLVEISLEVSLEPHSALIMPEESKTYGNALSPIDGTPIDTRKRHREHLKLHGVAMADDFKSDYARAAKEREAIQTGAPSKERREAVGRAIYETQQRARRARR